MFLDINQVSAHKEPRACAAFDRTCIDISLLNTQTPVRLTNHTPFSAVFVMTEMIGGTDVLYAI